MELNRRIFLFRLLTATMPAAKISPYTRSFFLPAECGEKGCGAKKNMDVRQAAPGFLASGEICAARNSAQKV